MTLLLAFSCSDDQENRLFQEQTVSATEVVTILDVDSQSRVVDNIITDLFENGQSGKSAKIEDCYVIDIFQYGVYSNF